MGKEMGRCTDTNCDGQCKPRSFSSYCKISEQQRKNIRALRKTALLSDSSSCSDIHRHDHNYKQICRYHPELSKMGACPAFILYFCGIFYYCFVRRTVYQSV